MRKLVQLLSFSLLAILVSGCGLSNYQIAKTQTFGVTTASVGKLGEEELVNIRNGIIAMNKELVAIDHTKTSVSLILEDPKTPERIAVRVAASKALKLYGELLVQLTTEDRSENLQKVSNALMNNTEVVLGKEFSSEKKDAISKIIANLGSFWVEKKKADAAKAIIPLYEESVNKLADLLSKDFSVDTGALGYLKSYELTAKSLKYSAMSLVNAGNKYNVLERAYAVNAYVMAEKALTRSKELSKKAQAAISGLKKANFELEKVIKEEKYSTDDIKKYAKQLQELVNMYQVLTH